MFILFCLVALMIPGSTWVIPGSNWVIPGSCRRFLGRLRKLWAACLLEIWGDFKVDFIYKLFRECCELRSELRCEVQKFIMKFTSPYVNKASNWLIFVKGPIRGFVYIRACEFQYELLNFTTKFGFRNEVRNEVRNIRGKVIWNQL
jgi:hypothetical protein